MKLNGKTVLITGASSGIGEATAKAFAKKGAHVLLLARRKEVLRALAADIHSEGGQASVYAVDLGNREATNKVIEEIKLTSGTPDILFNNAGVGRWLYVDETPIDEAIQMMNLPYFAAFHITQAFLPTMLERNSGHIITITSPAGIMPIEGAAAYSAARCAMRSLGKSLETDLRKTGVGTSLIIPGKVATDYFDNNPGSEEKIPLVSKLYRTLSAKEVAHSILNAVENNKKEVISPLLMKWTIKFYGQHPKLVEGFVNTFGSQGSRSQAKRGNHLKLILGLVSLFSVLTGLHFAYHGKNSFKVLTRN